MKKAKFPAFLATALLCFGFWLLITGQVGAFFDGSWSWEVLAAGAAVSLLAAAFTARFFIHASAFKLLHPARFLSFLLYVLLIFPLELIEFNMDMAVRAFGPVKKLKPGIMKVPTEIQSEYGKSMLANCITLTPGTMTLATVEENGKTYFYIHWIMATSTDGTAAAEFSNGTMEMWIRRFFD